MTDASPLQVAVQEALTLAYAEHGDEARAGGLVVDWTLVTEVVGRDGEIYLHTLRSHDIAPWKALGMLEAFAGDLRIQLATPVGDD